MNKITIGQATLINGDCMSLMRDTPDNYYELAIVDPPYGIGANVEQGLGDKRNGNRKKSKWIGGDWDKAVPTQDYFIELQRVSNNQIIWGGNYFNLPPTPCNLVWDKVQRIDQADCESAWTSFIKPSRIFTFSRSNLQGFQNPYRFHPTEKPVKLYEWLITNYAKAGDKILDTHGGSFSSAIACNNLGFDFTGIELDKDYYEAAVKRVMAANQQIRMFA